MHRTGLEPVTTRFEAGYSIQLSYRCESYGTVKARHPTGSHRKRQEPKAINLDQYVSNLYVSILKRLENKTFFKSCDHLCSSKISENS